MNRIKIHVLKTTLLAFFIGLLTSSLSVNAQYFLRTKGKVIVDENNDTILLRGMGLGGWMVKEGYMMQTGGFASAQHEIMQKIEDLIGKTNTDSFNSLWLTNHVTREDID